MQSIYKIGSSLSLISIVFASACSTAKVRVMPGEGGVNRVVVRDIERDGSEEAAVDAANDYCKDRKKTAVFLSEGTKYTGNMDESTRKTVRNASKAAMVVGAVGMGPHATRLGGGILGTAGMAGHAMTSDRDYESDLQFRCE